MTRLVTIFLVFICSSFIGVNASAQELNVISAGGGYAQSANHSMTWTTGETIIITSTSSSNAITQGFHQPGIKVVSVVEYQQLDISVYPNPARDNINIETSENTHLTIYDIQGKIVDAMDIYSSQTSIDVSYLSRGTYTLVFEANGALAKRMKIVIL